MPGPSSGTRGTLCGRYLLHHRPGFLPPPRAEFGEKKEGTEERCGAGLGAEGGRANPRGSRPPVRPDAPGEAGPYHRGHLSPRAPLVGLIYSLICRYCLSLVACGSAPLEPKNDWCGAEIDVVGFNNIGPQYARPLP